MRSRIKTGLNLAQLSLLRLSSSRSARPSFIGALPPELVFRILKLAADAEGSASLWAKQRYALLRSICLVCRMWGEAGTILLWRDVNIGKEVQAKLALRSTGFGRHAVHRLQIAGTYGRETGVTGISTGRLISRAKVMGHLDLRCYAASEVGSEFELINFLLSSPDLSGKFFSFSLGLVV